MVQTESDSLELEIPAADPAEAAPAFRSSYRLAATCWLLFLLGAALFFAFASRAVAERDWNPFLLMLAASLAWTFLLLIVVQQRYKGPDPGKVLARVSMLFLTLNLTNTLAVLSFI